METFEAYLFSIKTVQLWGDFCLKNVNKWLPKVRFVIPLIAILNIGLIYNKVVYLVW